MKHGYSEDKYENVVSDECINLKLSHRRQIKGTMPARLDVPRGSDNTRQYAQRLFPKEYRKFLSSRARPRCPEGGLASRGPQEDFDIDETLESCGGRYVCLEFGVCVSLTAPNERRETETCDVECDFRRTGGKI
ncbi:hypothetical protein ABKN59_010916 [Abortiporus biennis]